MNESQEFPDAQHRGKPGRVDHAEAECGLGDQGQPGQLTSGGVVEQKQM